MPVVNINHDVISNLKLYKNQLDLNDEIVLSINKDFIQNTKFINSTDLELDQIKVIDSSLIPGVSYARNTALKSINNEIIVFADDDDIPMHNRIKEIRKSFIEGLVYFSLQ